MGILSEQSSSSPYPDDSGLELGLSLGSGGGFRNKIVFIGSPPSSLSSSSSSSAPDNVSPLSNACPSNQVVGWPPIRAYRMNSMVNQVKCPSSEEFCSTVDKCKPMQHIEGIKNYKVDEDGKKKSNFVKVNMDGNGIGRKVDMSAHSCYETLAQSMEDMFFGTATTRRSKLLDGSSEFVLTYEDKDGDWMLVGDVPWGMFVNSVKRLRVMRTSEATGLGSKFQISSVMPI